MGGDLLARIEADRLAARAALEGERVLMRVKFPLVARIVDVFRAAAASDQTAPRLLPRPVYAANDAGETWGREPQSEGLAVDGDKLAHLPAFEASWRAFFAGRKEDHKTYRERMQRAIRPETRGIDEP